MHLSSEMHSDISCRVNAQVCSMNLLAEFSLCVAVEEQFPVASDCGSTTVCRDRQLNVTCVNRCRPGSPIAVTLMTPSSTASGMLRGKTRIAS